MTFPDQFGKDGGRTGGVLGQFGEKLNPNLTEPKINLAKLQRETRSNFGKQFSHHIRFGLKSPRPS